MYLQSLLFFSVQMHMNVHVYIGNVCEGQRTTVGVSSSLPPCGFWGLNFGLQAWQQAPLPPDPSHISKYPVELNAPSS